MSTVLAGPRRYSKTLIAAPLEYEYESRGVGEEANIVQDRFNEFLIHYGIPQTRYQILKFEKLIGEWRKETRGFSSVTDIVLNPAYQNIIGMGVEAVPLLLNELRKNPDHLFWALKAITEADPVPPEDKGRIKRMSYHWLEWGKQNGYIV